MTQLTCIACTCPIFKGQRAISLEFGQVEQSQKSQRDIIKGYAVDTIHFGCIQDYLGRIDGELYDSMMAHHKQVIRKQVVADLRDELKQEVYDEMVEEMGRTCAICQAEIDEGMAEEDTCDECAGPNADVGPLHEDHCSKYDVKPHIPLPPSPFIAPQLGQSK